MSYDRQTVTSALGYCLAHCDSEEERAIVEWVVEIVEESFDAERKFPGKFTNRVPA